MCWNWCTATPYWFLPVSAMKFLVFKGQLTQNFNLLPMHHHTILVRYTYTSFRAESSIALKARFSPQWWSGHSTTTHIVFTRFGLWRKLCDCSQHHFRARKYLIKRALLTILSISNCLAAVWKKSFYLQDLGCWGAWWVGAQPIYGLALTVFELLSWLQKRFCTSTPLSAYSPVWPGYDDKHHSRIYLFVERQKGYKLT